MSLFNCFRRKIDLIIITSLSARPDMYRLGFIHIPGSAGMSTDDALGQSLVCLDLPVHQVVCEDNPNPAKTFSLRVPKLQGLLTREILLSYHREYPRPCKTAARLPTTVVR